MTSYPRNRKTKRGFSLAAAVGALGLFLLWACHLSPSDSEDTFAIVADTSWTHCHSVRILLLDGDGKTLDTLFDDSLASIDQLRELDASRYQGGAGSVAIKGFLADGGTCFEEERSFEAGGSNVEVKPILDPTVPPSVVTVTPASLVLAMGSPAANLKAEVFPAHANPAMRWSVDGSGVVALDGLDGGVGNPARVRPLKAGQGKVTVRSLMDTSKSFTVDVRVNDVGAGNIRIGRDTVILFVKGRPESLAVSIPSEYAGQKVEWRVADSAIAAVDAQGRIKPIREGETQVQATLLPSGLSDAALVRVLRDVPRLTVNSAKGAPVGGEIVFSAVAVQAYGTLVSFRWDLLGDGVWDDSSKAGWSGDTAHLPAVKRKYDKEGTFVAKFQVLDSEGNTGEAQVSVDIGNQAPDIAFLRKDTTISVLDSIPMDATVRDVDGKVVWAGWDYEGDGQFDDTLQGDKAELKVGLGHRYQEAGNYLAVFRAMDDNGKASQDTARIRVEFDEPVADAGPDITVTAGSDFTFSAKGTDKYGAIAKRELKVGSGAFVALSKQDTVLTAPSQPGTVALVVRVTDDDGLSDVDTALVTVVLSSNADLSGLTLSAGTLVPSFQSNALIYAAQVAFSDSLVRVTPKVQTATTKIVVNGKEIPSGTASDPVRLNVGNNPSAFQILVTAADGSQRLYSVSVTRHPNSEATLSRLDAPGLELSPAFSSSVLEYADTVPFPKDTVLFKATVSSAGASLAFNDTGITSGVFTPPQPLKLGENVFTFQVTAQDGNSKTTYRIRILRLGRLLVQRKMGAAAPVVVDTFDMPVGSTRPLSGGSYAGWAFLKWSVTGGSATLADSLANPTSVTLKSGLASALAGFEALRYTVDLDVKGCGKVTPGADSTYEYGSSPEYRLTPSAGCRIKSVLLDGKEEPSAYDSVYTFAGLNANHTFVVQFVRAYTVDFKVAGKGSVLPAAVVMVDSGAQAKFTLKPDAGYKVAKNGLCTGNVCSDPRPDSTLVLDAVLANRSYTVTFVRGYRVTGLALPGAATISPVDSLVDSGSVVTWKFSLSANYRLDSLVVNNALTKETSAGVYTVNGINKDINVRLATKRQYNLTVAVYDTAQGTLNLAPGTRVVDSGTTHAFTATPRVGTSDLMGSWRVDTVLVNGVRATTTGTDAWSPRSWTIAGISANTTVKVTFWRYYKVTASAGDYHTVTPTTVNVDSGKSQSFTYTFNLPTGYYVSNVIFYRGDFIQYLSGNTLTLPSVTLGANVSLRYSNLYTITLVDSIPGSFIYPTICIIQGLADSTCTSWEEGRKSVEVQVPYGGTYKIAAPAQAGTGQKINPLFHYFQKWIGLKERTLCKSELSATATTHTTYTAVYAYEQRSGCTESP